MSKCLPLHHSLVIIPSTLHTLRYWQDCEMATYCPEHFIWFRMKFLSCVIYCIFKHSMGTLFPLIHISSWLSGNTLSHFVMPVIFFTFSRRELCLFTAWMWNDCHSFIHSIGMCRIWRFLAVLRSFFHSCLSCTFSCHPSPPTNYSSILSHLILPSVSWSTSQSCCSQIHI
jgi:hypothetical protein